MDKASLYACANSLQKRDATQTLDEFLPRMAWGEDELVLDVGCGPGDVTADVLLPRLPGNVQHVVGTDLSYAMVRHASEKYSNANGDDSDRAKAVRNVSLSFAQLDIADVVTCTAQTRALLADLLPGACARTRSTRTQDADVEGDAGPGSGAPGFSKVFSFYCLHWVQEQRRAVQSIHRLLAPGGEALIVFLARSPMFQVYERMATLAKWKPFMTDVDRFVSPYQHVADPAARLGNLLTDVGLQIVHCSCREQTFAFESLDVLRKSVVAVNPFLARIPSELQDAYVDDCMLEIGRLGLILEDNNNYKNKNNINNMKDSLNTRYSLLVAHARKPE